jgi:hypothetical protein
MEKASLLAQKSFINKKMLNETFGKIPCDFLNNKKVVAYIHRSKATSIIYPFNRESISLGISSNVANNEKFSLCQCI